MCETPPAFVVPFAFICRGKINPVNEINVKKILERRKYVTQITHYTRVHTTLCTETNKCAIRTSSFTSFDIS